MFFIYFYFTSDPSFQDSINNFYGIIEKQKNNDNYYKQSTPTPQIEKNELIEKVDNFTLKKINPTYLSYAGAEIIFPKNEKYELDVIGNIIKRKDEINKSYCTYEGVKRFGAGLKNMNNENTLNAIPQKYYSQYKS